MQVSEFKLNWLSLKVTLGPNDVRLDMEARPPVPEIDPYGGTSSFNAGLLVREVDMDLMRAVFWQFRDVVNHDDIVNIISMGVVPPEVLNQLVVEAEKRFMRVSTLIVLILRAYPIFNDHQR